MENNENDESNENVEMCSICYEDLTDNVHTLECGHKYHCNCIINWFRNDHSNCPLCNDTTSLNNITKYGVKIQTISEIKKLGRRKSCPENIKKQLDKIKKLELKDKEDTIIFKEFKKEHKELWKKYNNLREKKWINKRKIRKAEHTLLALVEITPIYLKK